MATGDSVKIEQPKVNTRISFNDWHYWISKAWQEIRTDSVNANALRLLWDIWALETAGRYDKAHPDEPQGRGMWNHNFGNMTPGAADAKYVNGYVVLHPVGYSPMHFASYETFELGALDWMRYFSRDVYKPVMAAAIAGDIDRFSHEMNVRGYYGKGKNGEDLEPIYTAGLKAHDKTYPKSGVTTTTPIIDKIEPKKESSRGGQWIAATAGIVLVGYGLVRLAKTSKIPKKRMI